MTNIVVYISSGVALESEQEHTISGVGHINIRGTSNGINRIG